MSDVYLPFLNQSIKKLWQPFYGVMDAIVPHDERACQWIQTIFLSLLAGLAGVQIGSQPVAMGATVQDAFKHNRARQNVIVGGGLILVFITLLSCVSSFMIYVEGFQDLGEWPARLLSMFAVLVVEGAFIWLVYGFTRAFSSFAERLISLAGMVFLVSVMLTNIVTHFMMAKHQLLSGFQNAWLSWGAVSVFVGVLVVVLLITLADPVSRLVRLELRGLGQQQEAILQAKSDSLSAEPVQRAMLKRAEYEARQLATSIIGDEDDEEYKFPKTLRR